MEETLHAGYGSIGLTLVYSEKPVGAKVFICQRLEEIQSESVTLFDFEVVGEMADQTGEDLKFLVVGS